MYGPRFSILAAMAAGLAVPQPAKAEATGHIPATATGPKALPQLVRLSEAGNAALMRGDLLAYYDFIPHSDDFLLMTPFGGAPTLGADRSPGAVEGMARFFRNGRFAQEVVQTVVTDDMVVLTTIERANVEAGGLPAQEWALRLTLVYRREAEGWRLIHRHADPLAHAISLERAAALGRGEAAP